jgi:hypothetical protein
MALVLLIPPALADGVGSPSKAQTQRNCPLVLQRTEFAPARPSPPHLVAPFSVNMSSSRNIATLLSTHVACFSMIYTLSSLVRSKTMATLYGYQHFGDFIATSDPAPSTYIGAANRCIDFMFGCDEAVNFVSRSGTLAYAEEGPQSDHRSLYLDLSVDYIQRPTWQSLQPASSRDLFTRNPELVASYHQSMMKYYDQHRMVQRIDYILNSSIHVYQRSIAKSNAFHVAGLGGGRIV